jgi:hypothetical protein
MPYRLAPHRLVTPAAIMSRPPVTREELAHLFAAELGYRRRPRRAALI